MGREILPFIYDNFDGFEENIAKVQKAWKSGFIDTTGREVTPCVYEEVDYEYADSLLYEGLAYVKKEGKRGFINRWGQEVIPFIYDSAEPFEDDLARVEKDGVSGVIDKSGRWIEAEE